MNGVVSATPASCAGCGAVRMFVVCPECGVIFDAPSDAFGMFGFPRSWAVDVILLEQRYELISRVLREKSSAREDVRWKVPDAIEALEGARRLLLDPFERGQYLLVAYGGSEREKPARKREFQSEVMEIDAAAMNARREGDSARLAAVVLEAEEKIASAIVAAGQSFTRLERSLSEEVGAAADALAEARLWRRKVNELRALLGG